MDIMHLIFSYNKTSGTTICRYKGKGNCSELLPCKTYLLVLLNLVAVVYVHIKMEVVSEDSCVHEIHAMFMTQLLSLQ